MKSIVSFLPFVVLLFIVACQEDEQLTTKEPVRFVIQIAESPSQAELPEAFSAELSSEFSSETPETKVVTFRKSGDVYVSDPMNLPPGEHRLIDLALLDPTLTTISELATRFSIGKDGSNNISIGRVAKAPRGYPLQIAVSIEENGKRKLTNATAYITNYDSESFSYNLLPKTNHIVLTGAPDQAFDLIIEKDGYLTYTTTFIYNELAKKRFVITLEKLIVQPGPAVTFQPSATYFSMWFHVMQQGSMILDWGENEFDTLTFNVDPEDQTGTAYFFRDNAYATSVPGARLTGDIDMLTGLYFEAAVDALDVQNAANLEELIFTNGDMATLDLQVNTNLKSLSFTDIYIGDLILPQQHAINNLFITTQFGIDWPTSSDLDYIIDNIHTNTVAANINNGEIRLSGVEVSAASAAKLEELQNSYGWTIVF